MTLVDTSVWIEVFSSRKPLSLDTVVDIEEVVTCLPVIQEVLQGFRDEQAFRIAKESMMAMEIVEAPLTFDVYSDAVGLYRAARRVGITVRSSVDCLIAACAIKNELEILHRDRDFKALASISPLRQRSL